MKCEPKPKKKKNDCHNYVFFHYAMDTIFVTKIHIHTQQNWKWIWIWIQVSHEKKMDMTETERECVLNLCERYMSNNMRIISTLFIKELMGIKWWRKNVSYFVSKTSPSSTSYLDMLISILWIHTYQKSQFKCWMKKMNPKCVWCRWAWWGGVGSNGSKSGGGEIVFCLNRRKM